MQSIRKNNLIYSCKIKKSCWCSSLALGFPFGCGAFVSLVPGKAWSLEKIRILHLFPQIGRTKFFTQIPKCASVLAELISASVPPPCTFLPVTILWWKKCWQCFLVYSLTISGDFRNFLPFLVGWCHGFSPDGEPRGKPVHHSLGKVLSLTERRHCKKKGGTRKIFLVTLWVAPNQNFEPQRGQGRVF